MTVNFEKEKKKNIRLAIGVASFGVLGFLCMYVFFFALMFLAPWTLFSLMPFPSFSEEVVGLDGKLLLFSKRFDFKRATFEEPPKEKMTMRIYDGRSLTEPEEIKPFSSLYPTEEKIYFFDKGLYRTFDMKKWEESKNPAIGSNPKGAVCAESVWILSSFRKKPVLTFMREHETRDIPLPEEGLEEKVKACSFQLLCLDNDLHLFSKHDGTFIWYRYDGRQWHKPEMFEQGGEFKAMVFKNELLLIHRRGFGKQTEITLRVFSNNAWSEPKILTIPGTSLFTLPAVFQGRPIIFQQTFFTNKYYFLKEEQVEGPYRIRKPFLFSADFWKISAIGIALNILFLLFMFLLSLLIRKYKLKTWSINSREYEFASLFRRFLAKCIDMLIITIPSIIPIFFSLKDDLIFDNPFKFMALSFLTIAVMVFGSFLYHSLLEGLWGKTIGKRLCGIVVLKDDFTKCTLGRGFLRNLMRIVDSFFYYLVAAVSIAGTMKWQRLGDLVAGTVVIRDKRK
ncbi:MAG: RDD family protein [Nitrospira sp.]|nr:RDD family protein [Nitrospira sp.]